MPNLTSFLMSPSSKLPDMRNHPFLLTRDTGAGSESVGDRAAPFETITPGSSLGLPGRMPSARQGVHSVIALNWQNTMESFPILKMYQAYILIQSKSDCFQS